MSRSRWPIDDTEGAHNARGTIDRSLPFPVLKAKSHINERAKAANHDPRFLVRIREGLPRMFLERASSGVRR